MKTFSHFQKDDFCWVYVTRNIQPDQELHIGIAANLPALLIESKDKEILYFRQFASTLDALAHKLLLTNVSSETLYRMIRENNPSLRNLSEDFKI